MANLPAAQENVALDAMFVPATVYYLSLHTATPGTTGASEVTGGSYARQAITFIAASGGVKSSGGVDAVQSFSGMPVEAGGVPYFGVWTAATSGTYLGGGSTTGLSSALTAGSTVAFTSGQVQLTVS